MTITLDKPTHRYFCGDRELVSVGTVVDTLTPFFDEQAAAFRVAAREHVDPSVILTAWANKRDMAAAMGTRVHEQIQNRIAGKDYVGEPMVQYSAWFEWWFKAMPTLNVIATEMIVGDLEYGIAGTLDLLAESSKTQKAHVFDWKTNETFTTENRWGDKMLPPFEDLPHCKLVHYSIQLSLYRLILERERKVRLGESWIIHLGKTATPYKALNLTDRLAAWLGTKPEILSEEAMLI